MRIALGRRAGGLSPEGAFPRPRRTVPPLRRHFGAEACVPAAIAYKKGPPGEKSSPEDGFPQQSRPKEALRRQNLAGGLIAGGRAVVAAPSLQRRRRNATAPFVAYGRGLPQLLQKRPVFCAPHEQVQVSGAAVGAEAAVGAPPPAAGVAPPPAPMP